MSDEDKMIITAAEAESLLPEGDYVHNYANPGAGMFIGCDYDREAAIEEFKKAVQIEIAGPNCKAMKHLIAVWHNKSHVTFFAADMDRLAAFEAARAGTST